MDTTNAPQIIEHLSKTLNFTPFTTRWIPNTAKFVLCGQTPKAQGIMQIFQLNKSELSLVHEITPEIGVKCSTFGACQSGKADMAWGSFDGRLNITDIDKKKTFFTVKAHDSIINCIDALGGDFGYGAPEIITGSRDGCVRVWDPRQQSPVLSLEPVEKEPAIPDCWTVCFGNSYNNDERSLAAGYDNGDVKLFDMRKNSLVWDTNLKNGVCGVEFDRKDIIMNKLVATTLEGKFHIYDLRTYNKEGGYPSLCEQAHKSTVWGVAHLPQNREVFLTQGGNGSVNIYQYHYPKQRVIEDTVGGGKRGIIGSIELLNSKDVAQQPVSSFDWNKDKVGLGVFCAFDQTCKVVIVTKLNLL